MDEKKRAKGLPMFPGAIQTYTKLSFLIIGEGIFVIAQAFYLARAITFLFEGHLLSEVVRDIGLFFVAFICRYLIIYVEQIIAENYASHTVKKLRHDVIIRYLHDDIHLRQRLGTGHLVTLAVEGIDHLKTYVEMIGIRVIKTVVVPGLIVIFIFFYDVISAVILIVTVPIVIIFMILLGMAAEKMADKQYKTYTRLANHFIDSLKGLETLMYLGKSKSHAKSISYVSGEYRKATMRTLRVAFLSSFALDFFTSLSIAFVAVGLGFRLIDGNIMLLPALTILILAPEYFAPIKQVGKDYHATLDGQIALHHINELVNQEISKVNQSDNIDEVKMIQFENVQVQAKEQSLLRDISLKINDHVRWIGIVGPSGAGKSTLINLLAGRIVHDRGTIRINGEKITTLQQDSWYEHIAYIPQHPYIFPVTVADNIRFYKRDATDEQVMEVIEQIGLKDFVATLPKGIHEKIGEGGHSLSGGQEQRIALARALLSDQPIILLDEPTAHLDIETEYDIKQMMGELFTDKFVFIATHRMHWLQQMDHVILLEAGEVAAQGEHLHLLEKHANYAFFVREKRGTLHE